MQPTLLALHVLGATVWTGGHLLLALRYLPDALRTRDPALVQGFEARFEPLGLPALLVQVLTGIPLLALRWGATRSPDFLGNPVGQLLLLKLLLLLATVGLALHARLRLIPTLDARTLPALAVHVRLVTLIAVLFVLAGVALRFAE
jgi:putative copper export protein